MECPILLEPYTEEGQMRPVMMPTCGHTISKAAAQAVLEQAQVGTRTSNGKKAMRCPSCNRVQPEVGSAHEFPPNWTVMESLREPLQQPPSHVTGSSVQEEASPTEDACALFKQLSGSTVGSTLLLNENPSIVSTAAAAQAPSSLNSVKMAISRKGFSSAHTRSGLYTLTALPPNALVHTVTRSRGHVICCGDTCMAKFTDVTFDKCSFVALAGAVVTLDNPFFTNMHASKAGLSIYAHGVGTNVTVRGGTITGGTQGVVVQDRACLTGANLTITGVEVAGVEVRDKGSFLTLTSCKLHEFSTCYDHVAVVDARERKVGGCTRGVHVHWGSNAHLSKLSISGMQYGVSVRTHASATLADCIVTDTMLPCVIVRDGGKGHLNSCTLSNSLKTHGLHVTDKGSCAHAARCHFLRNSDCGAFAAYSCLLTVESCTSSGNKGVGYMAHGKGAMVKVIDCCSNGDSKGYVAVDGGKLKAHNVTVDGVLQSGTGKSNSLLRSLFRIKK